MQSIYIDSFIIFNFLMDYFSLFLTSRILRLSTTVGRISASSVLGCLYAALSVLYSRPFWIIYTVAMPFLLVLVAFRFRLCRVYIKATALFWCISLLSGGIVGAAVNLISQVDDSYRINGLLIIAGAFICQLFAKLMNKSIRQKLSCVSCSISFEYCGNVFKLNAIVDSGNFATEPVTGLPVIFASRQSLISLSDSQLNLSVSAGGMQQKRIFRAFRPNGIVCFSAGKKRLADAVIAVDDISTDYNGADAIVPLSII